MSFSFRKFIHNNLVAIIILPTIVAIHYGVNKIQDYEHFVAEHERKDLPIVQAAKVLKEKLLGSESESIEIESRKES